MKKNNIDIQQIFKELVLQDQSFSSQKKDIISLLSRMEENKPTIHIDENFKNNLKSRLENHINYINNLMEKPKTPAANLNWLARLISYWIPAIALGVVIFLVVPYTPNKTDKTQVINKIESEYNNSLILQNELKEENNRPIIVENKKKEIVENKNIKKQEKVKINTLYDNDIKQENDRKEEILMPTILKTTTPILWSDQMNMDSISTQENSIPLLQSNTTVQKYVWNNLLLSYKINNSWEDLMLEWTMEHCNSEYIISEALVWVSINGTIDVSAKDILFNTIKKIRLHFENGIIVDIKNLEQCK